MRLWTLAAGLAAAGLAVHGLALAADQPSRAAWIGAWGFTPAPLPSGAVPAAAPAVAIPLGVLVANAPPPVFTPLVDNPGALPVDPAPSDHANITLRQLVRVSIGGRRMRLRFSNEGGADVMTLGAVHVAQAAGDGALVPGTDRVVTFAGQAGVTLPASAPVLSDPIDLPTQALDRLYISVFVPGAISGRAPRTLFEYVAAKPGDATAETAWPGARLTRLPPLATLVEVEPPAAANVVVTLGDSITEGATSTSNAFRSWPDRLAERLAGHGWAVVNAGISGNRLLRYGAGPSALARFDRDVLSVPGVRTVILLEGINDIGRSFTPTGPTEPVTFEALKAADEQIIARAHEHGIRVIGATLTPYKGAAYAAPEGEAVREALNAWIKTGGAFDGVIDFAPVVAAPADPLSLAPGFNIRDHLHPNDAGYRAMGDAIDLSLIVGR